MLKLNPKLKLNLKLKTKLQVTQLPSLLRMYLRLTPQRPLIMMKSTKKRENFLMRSKTAILLLLN